MSIEGWIRCSFGVILSRSRGACTEQCQAASQPAVPVQLACLIPHFGIKLPSCSARPHSGEQDQTGTHWPWGCPQTGILLGTAVILQTLLLWGAAASKARGLGALNIKQNHGMIWVVKDLKSHPVPSPVMGRDTFQYPSAPSPVQPEPGLCLRDLRSSGGIHGVPGGYPQGSRAI